MANGRSDSRSRRRGTRRTAALTLAVLGALAGTSSAEREVSILRGQFPPAIEQISIVDRPQLCGIDCLYLARGLLGDNGSSFDAIRRQFPDAIDRGTSLQELERYLRALGYHTRLESLSERALARRDGRMVGIVLVSADAGYHLIVKMRDAEGGVRVLDPAAAEALSIAPSALDTVGLPTLLVSRSPLPFPFWSGLAVAGLAASALLAGGWFLRRRRWVPAVIAAAALGRAGAFPKIDCEKEVVLRPAAGAGELRSAGVLQIKNLGDESLKIPLVKVNCPCLRVAPPPREIEPGGRADVPLEMTVEAGDFNGRRVQIALKSNDPFSPTTLIRVVAFSTMAPYTVPAVLDFGRVEAGRSRTRPLYVYVPTDAEMPAFIRDVAAGSARGLSAEVKWQKVVNRNVDGAKARRLYCALIEVTFTLEAGAKNSPRGEIHVLLADGESLAVPWSLADGNGERF